MTETRYFSHIKLREDLFRGGDDSAALFWQMLREDDLYASHRLIWKLFPQKDYKQERKFLFRQIGHGLRTSFYVISLDIPKNDMFKIETKPYILNVSPGTVLYYDLLANPGHNLKNRKRRCAVQVHQERLEHEGISCSLEEAIEEAGPVWLKKREEWNGFRVLETQVSGYRLHRTWKDRERNAHLVQFSTLQYKGYLEVLDVERFRRAVYQGIGPAKAFGCGMMLVQRRPH